MGTVPCIKTGKRLDAPAKSAVHPKKVCSGNFVVLHDCLQKRTWVFCKLVAGFVVAGPTTPLADQRSPASPGSVSMGLGTWPIIVALPEIKAVDIEKQYVICKYVIVNSYASIYYENVPQPSLGYDAIYMQV